MRILAGKNRGHFAWKRVKRDKKTFLERKCNENGQRVLANLGLTQSWQVNERWGVSAGLDRSQTLIKEIAPRFNSKQLDYSAGLSVGYQVITNAWASLGYNFVGFRDRDFTNGSFMAQGPFIRFRIKLDQDSARRALTWFER